MDLVYKPDNYPGPIALDATLSKELDEYHKNSVIQINIPEESKLYVKFSRNISFSESFLKKHNIEYTPEDLEDIPLGKCYVVRRENKNERQS